MKALYAVLVILLFVSCSSIQKESDKQKGFKSAQELKTEKKESKIDIWTKIEKKADWFQIGTHQYNTIDSISNDFAEFYSRFISDSTFQLEHLKFPFAGAIGECDSTIVFNKENWETLKWDFRKDFYNPIDSNIIKQSEAKFYFENNREEIGLMLRIGFEKINNTWILTLLEINNC